MAKASQVVSNLRCETIADDLSEAKNEDASLTEVLHLAQSSVETLKEFLSRLDTIVGDDFHQIMEKISETRDDMQLLNTKELDVDPLSSAENELKLVVKATEDATNRIMEAAETIMTADPEDPATYHTTVESNVMEIFEACSFQDITGQRINRVVETLDFVDYRIHKIAKFLGIENEKEARDFDETAFLERLQRKDDLILHGPQDDGEGVSQNDIDNLF
ncbi:MAG: chemotaxis protein [Rhizobiales bacterium]|nr:chemotaxis protein [Hyphomicrobiales bacterium]